MGTGNLDNFLDRIPDKAVEDAKDAAALGVEPGRNSLPDVLRVFIQPALADGQLALLVNSLFFGQFYCLCMD